MEIEIFNQTEEKIQEYLNELKEMLTDFCKREKLDNVVFNIIIVDNNTIKEINRDYRGKDAPTDVISFALEDDKNVIAPEGIRVLGDIYISVDKAREQAKEYNHTFKRELSFLAVHGLLHLLGYDHMKEEDEKIMFSKQEEVLNYYGIYK